MSKSTEKHRIAYGEAEYNRAINSVIEIVKKDFDESLQGSISNTFASQHLKALIPKIEQLKVKT